MDNSSLTAIVLAGGVASQEFTKATGATNRALAELAPGKTMLDYILAALRGASHVGRIYIVGDVPMPSSAAGSSNTVSVLRPGSSLIDNILIGLNAAKLGTAESVFLVSADIPFITSEAIDDFAVRSLANAADFCYPIIRMRDYDRQFGRMKRTTLMLEEGAFTGGNIMLVRAGVITQNALAIRNAYAARKSVFKLGMMLGWGLLARIALSQKWFPNLLTIPMLERAVSRVLGRGTSARAIITPHASLGTDVDKPEDVVIAREMLAASAGS